MDDAVWDRPEMLLPKKRDLLLSKNSVKGFKMHFRIISISPSLSQASKGI